MTEISATVLEGIYLMAFLVGSFAIAAVAVLLAIYVAVSAFFWICLIQDWLEWRKAERRWDELEKKPSSSPVGGRS